MEQNKFDLAEAGRKGAAAGKGLRLRMEEAGRMAFVMSDAVEQSRKALQAFRDVLDQRLPPVKACIGCINSVPTRMHDDFLVTGHCKVYRDPAVMMRWVDGKSLIGCSFNYHNLVKLGAPSDRKRVGQQKQKRGNRK